MPKKRTFQGSSFSCKRLRKAFLFACSILFDEQSSSSGRPSGGDSSLKNNSEYLFPLHPLYQQKKKLPALPYFLKDEEPSQNFKTKAFFLTENFFILRRYLAEKTDKIKDNTVNNQVKRDAYRRPLLDTLASKYIKMATNKIITSMFILALLMPVMATGSDLYHEEISRKVEKGKNLIMVFDELDRQEKFSIVRINHTSGASVPSIMFMVKGCYEIAKLRGESHFINLKEWSDEQGNWIYKIGYTSDPSNDPNKYFGDDIDTSKELEYFSVKDYARIFEKR